jgi:hypothetical protein
MKANRFANISAGDLSKPLADLSLRRRAARIGEGRQAQSEPGQPWLPIPPYGAAGVCITSRACPPLTRRWTRIGLPRWQAAGPVRVVGAEAEARSRTVVRSEPAAVHTTLRVFLCLSAALLLLGAACEADVWEFDQQGNVLRSPNEQSPHNSSYDTSIAISRPQGAPVKSSRSAAASAHRAVYRPMAEGVAAVYAQDPAVAHAGLRPAEFVRVFVALIDQESRFNPQALSPKGARGLGQLMPQTAAQLGVDAAEPMANLHGAARYLTAQLAAFGRLDWALAAYNAGPHRVDQYGGVPPYQETRDYVARITAAAELPGSPASPSTQASAQVPALKPEVGRARVAASRDLPALDEPRLDDPRQGTVLEWKR